MQVPLLGWVTDVGRVQQQRQSLCFVHPEDVRVPSHSYGQSPVTRTFTHTVTVKFTTSILL